MTRFAGKVVFHIAVAMASLGVSLTGASAGTINAVRVQDEKPFYKCWQYSLNAPLVASPVTDNGTVFLPEAEGRLRSLDSDSGTIRWSVELGGSIVSNLLVVKSVIYVVTSPAPAKGTAPASSIIRFINADSGITKRSIEVPYNERFYIFETPTHLLVTDRAGRAAAFDLASGDTLWRRDLGTEVAVSPGISGRFLSVASRNGAVKVIENQTGSVSTQLSIKHRVSAIAMFGSDTLIIGDERGNILSYRAGSTSPDWKYKIGGAVASISAGGDDVLVTSLDNFLYSMDPASGSVNWRKRLSGRAIYAPLWSEGKVFSPTIGESTVTVSDLSSGKTVNRIELGENMYPLQVPSVTGTGNIIFAIPGSIIAFGAQSCSK